MLSLYAYYLMSPLNIILLFFRTEWLPQAIELLILIKISQGEFNICPATLIRIIPIFRHLSMIPLRYFPGSEQMIQTGKFT